MRYLPKTMGTIPSIDALHTSYLGPLDPSELKHMQGSAPLMTRARSPTRLAPEMPPSLLREYFRGMNTWTPKVCKTMAFGAVTIHPLGHFWWLSACILHPFGLLLMVLGHFFTIFWGPGNCQFIMVPCC